MQNFVPTKLNKHNYGQLNDADSLVKLICLKAPQLQVYEGSCRAIAEVGLPTQTYIVGTSASGRHAEEHIAEQYYDLTKSTIVTIASIYIDLAPCNGQYGSHKCANLFTPKGKTLHRGNLHGKVRFDSLPNGTPCPIYFLLSLPQKGESANLSALNFGGISDAKFAQEKILQVWQYEP